MVNPDELFEVVVEVLGDRAMHEDDVRAQIVERGVDTGRTDRYGIDVLGRVLQLKEQLTHFLDGRVAYIPAVMRDVALAVEVDARAAERGFTIADANLDAIFMWLMERTHDRRPTRLIDADGVDLGSLTTDGFTIDGVESDVIIWPQGMLDDLVGRDATISIVDDETVRLTLLDQPGVPTDELVAAARRAFDATKRPQALDTLVSLGSDPEETAPGPDAQPNEILTSTPVEVLTEIVLIDPDTCRSTPMPPLADLLAAAELEMHRGNLIGAAGTDWEALDFEFRLRRCELEHDFDREQAKRFVLLTGAATTRRDDGGLALGDTDTEVAGALTVVATLLEDAPVAEAAWNHWADNGHTGEGLEDITSELFELFGDEPLSGVSWLRARQAMVHDRTDEALELLERARHTQSATAHAGVLTDLAAIEADRSNPLAARRLLNEAGVATEVDFDEEFDASTAAHGFGAELAEEIAPFAATRPRPMAGRNETCPCGSRRKYKQCHLGNELHPIDHRAGWLYVKMMRFMELIAPNFAGTIADDIVDEVLDPSLRRMVMNSYLPTDLALHEGGIGQRFAGAKASLLPADELALTESWNSTDRSIYEVVRSTHDAMTVIDLANRERITIRDTVPEEPLEAGWKVIGRLLPVGDDTRAYGGFLPVNDDMVDPLIEAFATAHLETVAISIGQIFEAAEAHDEMQQLFDDSLDTSELESLIATLTDDD